MEKIGFSRLDRHACQSSPCTSPALLSMLAKGFRTIVKRSGDMLSQKPRTFFIIGVYKHQICDSKVSKTYSDDQRGIQWVPGFACHHTVMGHPPDSRADHLNRRCDCLTVAASTLERPTSTPLRGHIRCFRYVSLAVSCMFGHLNGHLTPQGDGTPA